MHTCTQQQLRCGHAASCAGRNVNGKCQQELLDFKMDRGSAINKDVPLGECACYVAGCHSTHTRIAV